MKVSRLPANIWTIETQVQFLQHMTTRPSVQRRCTKTATPKPHLCQDVWVPVGLLPCQHAPRRGLHPPNAGGALLRFAVVASYVRQQQKLRRGRVGRPSELGLVWWVKLQPISPVASARSQLAAKRNRCAARRQAQRNQVAVKQACAAPAPWGCDTGQPGGAAAPQSPQAAPEAGGGRTWVGQWTYRQHGWTEHAHSQAQRASSRKAPPLQLQASRQWQARLDWDAALAQQQGAHRKPVLRVQRQHLPNVPQRIADGQPLLQGRNSAP